VNHAVDKLAVAFAAAGVSGDAITALRKIALACNRASVQFAVHNPGAAPVVEEEVLTRYTALFDALAQSLLHTGKRKTRKQNLAAAMATIGGVSS
jgi:hypothetical protein